MTRFELWPMVIEVTALPTEPQSMPGLFFVYFHLFNKITIFTPNKCEKTSI